MGYCSCTCHRILRGEQRSAAQAGRFVTAFEFAQAASVWEYNHAGVSERDPVEAAMASGCSCIDNHCQALSGPPPALRPQPYRQQADGYCEPDE